jgi:hypothetical protein
MTCPTCSKHDAEVSPELQLDVADALLRVSALRGRLRIGGLLAQVRALVIEMSGRFRLEPIVILQRIVAAGDLASLRLDRRRVDLLRRDAIDALLLRRDLRPVAIDVVEHTLHELQIASVERVEHRLHLIVAPALAASHAIPVALVAPIHRDREPLHLRERLTDRRHLELFVELALL